MKALHIALVILIITTDIKAQEPAQDDTTRVLEEIKIKAAKRNIHADIKQSTSIDEYLAASEQVSFIKRGAYAWEPLLNNMTIERSSITIDGMHIFGACTDKMDPVSTYLESNNLSSIDIRSGQEGNMHGATIGGNIDFKRKVTPFGLLKKWSGIYQTGVEWNNKQVFNLLNLSYSGKRFVTDGSIAYRKAGNYYDGNQEEVQHSQYSKLNASAGLAYKTSELSSIRLDAIFDVAKDVGYPALPMDLWLSRAIITSATYKQLFEKGSIRSWNTKLYFNAVEHYMDDTKRPENLVHMDMPGWSTTYGMVSNLQLEHRKLVSNIQFNGYNNLSIAEMRMYPQDRSKRTMFAYSWPWVTTTYGGVSVNNVWMRSENTMLRFGASLGYHYNYSRYVEFNRIFYPHASQKNKRILTGLHVGYEKKFNAFDFSLGAGYGQRAPSVSEGYGYYIYNSFDRYDYVGNPNLKNEISYEVNAGVGFQKEELHLSIKANYFHIRNYIVGKVLSIGSPMNYQSVGVKAYSSLKYARIFNATAHLRYDIWKHLHWESSMTYARATDNTGTNLPFIRPLHYNTSLMWMRHHFHIKTMLQGDFAHVNYSPEYGERSKPAYMIWNIAADYAFALHDINAVIQLGVENLLNKQYSTYADWGNIPRMGRNLFMSLKLAL
mgnify:CR=1 FL=1